MTVPKHIETKLRKVTARCPHKRHQMGCVLTDSHGAIISDGCAHASNIRLAQTTSMHAEIHCLGRGRYRSLRGTTAYVMARARKSGNVTIGKPCLTCAIAMRSAGVEKVFYSVSNGVYAELDLESDLSKLKVYKKGCEC